MAISVVSFSFSRATQTKAQLSAGWWFSLLHHITNWSGPQAPSGVPSASSAGWWLSLPHLDSNSSELQLTDFLSTPSYIIVQSPSQSPTKSLEWHVWSSSSRNNCHVVQRSLSSGASVYEYIMGFYLVLFRQPNPPTRFPLITAIGMCHFLPVNHFGMACLAGSKGNIQQHLLWKILTFRGNLQLLIKLRTTLEAENMVKRKRSHNFLIIEKKKKSWKKLE